MHLQERYTKACRTHDNVVSDTIGIKVQLNIRSCCVLVVFWNILLHFPFSRYFRFFFFNHWPPVHIATSKWNGKLFNNDMTHKMKKGESILLFCATAYTHINCGQRTKVASFVFTIKTNKKRKAKRIQSFLFRLHTKLTGIDRAAEKLFKTSRLNSAMIENKHPHRAIVLQTVLCRIYVYFFFFFFVFSLVCSRKRARVEKEMPFEKVMHFAFKLRVQKLWLWLYDWKRERDFNSEGEKK